MATLHSCAQTERRRFRSWHGASRTCAVYRLFWAQASGHVVPGPRAASDADVRDKMLIVVLAVALSATAKTVAAKLVR